MSAELPALGRAAIAHRLADPLGALALDATHREALVEALWQYYTALRQWSPRLALVGAGTADVVVERHFGESLAAAPLLPASGVLVDVGSGAGFPGLVIAAMVPALECALVESRLRKAVFLRAAARQMGVSIAVLQERVQKPLSSRLPDAIDCLTARAIRFPAAIWGALCERVPSGGRVLVWAGAERPPVDQLELVGEVPLAASHSRRILHFQKP